MSLIMNVAFNGTSISEKLDLAELEGLETFCSSVDSLRSAFEMVFGKQESDGSRSVPRDVFFASLEILVGAVKSTRLVSTTYSIFGSPMPGVIRKGSSTGVHLTIGGAPCTLMGGSDSCTMTRYARDDNGEWKAAFVEDVRNFRSITTDYGEFQIKKRRKPIRTLKFLKEIERKLKTAPRSCEVTITIG